MPVTIPVARTPTPFDVARLALVSALWGSSFLCNAVALRDFAPVAIAGWRVTMAALVVLLVCVVRGAAVTLDRRTVTLFLMIGLLNGAAPFTLIGWGQLHVESATAAILIAASPFATLLFSHFMTDDDRFTWQRLAGLVIGFVGVLVLLGRGLVDGGGSLAGMLAIVLAACCYALSALLIRRLGAMSSLVIVAGTLLASAALLMPFVLWLHPPWQQQASAGPLAALAFLALGPTAAAYVLRTAIVQRNGAVFMSGAGYLIPPFAMLWAWLFLGERPTATIWMALAMILAGLAIGRRGSTASPRGTSGGPVVGPLATDEAPPGAPSRGVPGTPSGGRPAAAPGVGSDVGPGLGSTDGTIVRTGTGHDGRAV